MVSIYFASRRYPDLFLRFPPRPSFLNVSRLTFHDLQSSILNPQGVDKLRCLGKYLLQFAALIKLLDDIATTYEFAVDV